MLTQATLLNQRIADAGWRIVRKTEMPHWWADEIWQLESIWSPVGVESWITFLVDPENDDNARKKGQHVWAAAVSIQSPTSRITNEFKFVMSLKSGWRKDLEKFVSSSNHIREIA